MEIKQGYAYHIKDEYFIMAEDEHLMKNKEDGNYRPTLYCIKDNKYDIYWMIPISSQYDKYADIRSEMLRKGKKCKGIVLGKYDGKKAAFLIQNMFPVTLKYIDHVHTRNGNPVPVNRKLQEMIRKNTKSLIAISEKGIKVTFTDIIRLRNRLIQNTSSII